MSVIRPDSVSRKPEPPRAAPPSRRHDTATIAPLPTARPKRRKSLFAHQIWSAERKPSFARSSIYGYAR